MKVLNEYTIPLKGLQIGIHIFKFRAENAFFSEFENALYTSGKFDVQVEFDKRSNFFVLNFDINGSFSTNCDRCTASIQLPVSGEHQLIVKLTEKSMDEDANVVFVDPMIDTFNIAQYVYEFINLSVPLLKVYDCEAEKQQPCDVETLKALENAENEFNETEQQNPVWDELKGLLEN